MGVTLLILSGLESVRAWFRTELVCSPVQALTAHKDAVPVGTYYARVVYGYRPPPPAR